MKGSKLVLKCLVLGFLFAVLIAPVFATVIGSKVSFTGIVVRAEAPTWRYCGDYFVTMRVMEIRQDPGNQLSAGQEFPVYYAAAQGLRNGDVVDVRGTSCLAGGPRQCVGSVVVIATQGDYISFAMQTMADVNGDSIVNLLDLVAVALAYRTGGPVFDPRADVNRDGVVNLLDLVLVSRNYGRSWGD
ncbi:MAG: dockerin type I domain-containing protein [Anaerolineae bacterium]